MSARDNASFSKSEEAGYPRVKEKASSSEKAIPLADEAIDAGSERVNVGLHEFALAKQSGLRVTREENRR